MTHEPVRSIVVHRLSQSLDGVELVVKATLDELGHDPDRLRDALAERTQAEATLRTATELERLADALDKHSVATVSELDPQVVRDAIDGTQPTPIRRRRKTA